MAVIGVGLNLGWEYQEGHWQGWGSSVFGPLAGLGVSSHLSCASLTYHRALVRVFDFLLKEAFLCYASVPGALGKNCGCGGLISWNTGKLVSMLAS